ncbi:MAG TPA: hypothetical protein VIR30_08760, partial [Nocardioides sp.]
LARRAAERSLLHHAAHWADLHGDHEGVTRGHGSTDGEDDPRREHPTYRRFGGDGTPLVSEFATAELGISLQVHPLSARSWIADALDLRHRLAPLWTLTLEPTTADLLEVWLLRKIASRTRHLPATAAQQIAEDLAALITSLPTGRLLERLDSLVLLADAEADEAERSAQLRLRFAHFNRTDQRGLSGLYARLSSADAVTGDRQVQRLAELLLAHDRSTGIAADDLDTLDTARSRALGLLIADPATAHALLAGVIDPEDRGDADRADSPSKASAGRATGTGTTRPALTLHLHLSEDALQALAIAADTDRTAEGVGRLEGHGPLSLTEALELLRLSDVTIAPVLDPAATAPVDSYAFTGSLREAVFTRTPADIYPYARNTTHAMDIDHTVAYRRDRSGRPDGPGQTSLDNAGPMTRHHHRIKTSGPVRVRQPLPGTYIWRTLNDRYRITNNTGTHQLDPRTGADLCSDNPERHYHAMTLITQWSTSHEAA